ncbi:MAG: hypothetical protein KKB51_17310 [Candidatus Riflebacteria bacterium]|nr:hypothetical protein [Candidatus Riflebacteria bacterium]
MKMPKLQVFCMVLLACCALPFVAAAFNTGDAVNAVETPLKAAAESVMTNPNNVIAGSDVSLIWKYVDYLWTNDRQLEAKKYIESGLALAPFNYLYQAKLALILAKQDSNAAAIDRARIVYEKSEDPEPVKLVLNILGKKDVAPFKPIEKIDFASPTVVLVAIGKVDRILLKELQQKITDYLGLEVVVFSELSNPPEADRSLFTSEINKMRSSILALPDVGAYLRTKKINVSQLKVDNELFVQTLTQFLEQNNSTAAEDFKKNMALAKTRAQQWKYDTLRDYLIEMAKPFRNKNWLLVGITEYDLYIENTNFVFAGTNPHAQAIISYKRFTGDFNNEPQNRKRLVSRLFKQFLSVFGLLNGMVRCSFPECARVFPKTLAEHDEKPEYLCNECRQTLEKLLKISIRTPTRR